jgi:hypothetical protein
MLLVLKLSLVVRCGAATNLLLRALLVLIQ